jgi:hypothetical protein
MHDVFYIVPAPGRAIAFFGVIGALFASMLVLFAVFAYASLAARFEITDDGLRIRSALYGRTIPAASLVVDEARIVDMREELQPTIRTNGIGLPGYAAGWFRVRNQGRALLFVTDRRRVVNIPTTEGYAVMLSVQQPEAFLRRLQEVGQ